MSWSSWETFWLRKPSVSTRWPRQGAQLLTCCSVANARKRIAHTTRYYYLFWKYETVSDIKDTRVSKIWLSLIFSVSYSIFLPLLCFDRFILYVYVYIKKIYHRTKKIMNYCKDHNGKTSFNMNVILNRCKLGALMSQWPRLYCAMSVETAGR